jgi:hypothetical protein
LSKKGFTPAELKEMVRRRQAGEKWNVLAADCGMTPAGLRHHLNRVFGEIKLDPKTCPYCKQSFVPSRIDCTHCGKPDCYLQHRKAHWKRWDRAYLSRTEPKGNEIKVPCLGNYCGGKLFRTPLVNDHGRLRPLYRVCPRCRERASEYCTAFGGC